MALENVSIVWIQLFVTPSHVLQWPDKKQAVHESWDAIIMSLIYNNIYIVVFQYFLGLVCTRMQLVNFAYNTDFPL